MWRAISVYMHVMQPASMFILLTCMHTINAIGWRENTSCICACVVCPSSYCTLRTTMIAKMWTSGVCMHRLIILYHIYIIRIILRQEWIDQGAKVMTSISTSSKGWANSIYTTVQNQAHSSSIYNNIAACTMQVCMLWARDFLYNLLCKLQWSPSGGCIVGP